MAGKNCVICNKPSGMYPLCTFHLKEKSDGKIVKCETCSTWHYKTDVCKCNNPQNDVKVTIDPKNDKEKSKEDKTISSSKIGCILCGENSSGYLFCPKCYHKNKNKSVVLKITNCTDIEILEASYESPYTCEDGHIVKSKSEMAIDNYLFHKGIAHAYEKPFPIDSIKEHDLHPDFYLPEKDLYIEHWGLESENAIYTNSKDYKIKKYKELNATIISTYEKDMNNISAALDRKLKFYKNGEVNLD